MKRQSPTLAKTLARISLGVAACVAATFTAYAAVTFDSATGTGFVGKGDVQLALGLNNKKLQEKANDVEFRASSVVVTEVTWICTNTNNENTQERQRTTTTTIAGVVSSAARERNQITGFILEGYDGDTTESSTSEGNPLNSCPSGPWTLTTPAGDPEVVSEDGNGLQVSIDGIVWEDLE
jgi:hypothetical protein